jgi:hypothetical protein
MFQLNVRYMHGHCCGSVSRLDPDSMGSLDPYPDPDPDPGEQKLPTNIEKSSFLRADGYSCSLDLLYRGLGIRKWQF